MCKYPTLNPNPLKSSLLENKDYFIGSFLYSNISDYKKIKDDNPPLDYVINKCTPPPEEKPIKLGEKVLTPQNRGKLYRQVSKSKAEQRKEFARYKWFLNNRTGELVKFKSMSLENLLSKTAAQTLFAIQQIQARNKDKEGIFLTLTLPPEYHAIYTNEKNRKIKNQNFNSLKIEEGYRNLLDTVGILRRKFYKKFKHNLDYIRIVEPHADFCPHLHIQYYCKSDEIDKTIKYIENTLENQIKANKIGKKYDIKHLKDTDKTNISAYITKYLIKTQEKHDYKGKKDRKNDYRDIDTIDGWKRLHKIRMFSHSRLNIPKSFYNQIVNKTANNIIKDSDKYENLGEYAINEIKYITSLHSYDEKTKVRVKNNIKNPTLTIVKHTKKYNKIEEIIDDYNYVYFEYKEFRTTLKTHIYNNKSELIHNSKWWELIEYNFSEYKDTETIENYKKYANNINYQNDYFNYFDDKYFKIVYDNY